MNPAYWLPFIVFWTILIIGLTADAHAAECVSQDTYSQLSLGQTMRYQRLTVGLDPSTHNHANDRIRRTYPMCDGRTLHTRYEWFNDHWTAFVVDTHIGPEPDASA